MTSLPRRSFLALGALGIGGLAVDVSGWTIDTDGRAAEERRRRLAATFPHGVPTLWCPLLTHYTREGAIDRSRILAHLQHISPSVKGYLVPGSTGDGWELTGAEVATVMDLILEQAASLDFHVLIGALTPTATETVATITDRMKRLRARTGIQEADACLAKARVRGFTVCPPTGERLSQEEIRSQLETILKQGLPTALYQLPQITKNEMSPEVVADLAARYGNFVLFKDSSGADHVATSRADLGGVFTVRGAEGGYAGWLSGSGGPYRGLLLSTANCFARPLMDMVEHVASGRKAEASRISAQISAMVDEAFALVAPVKVGNAFANANKAMDHFFAFGPKAVTVPPPRLHAGVTLPVDIIRATGAALEKHALMPTKGYLG